MAVTIDDLGITQEELVNRVVDRIADLFLLTKVAGEDGEEWDDDSSFAKNVKREVQTRVDQAVNALADKHVLPNVTQYIESLTLQETTKWGEKRGKPLTFIEYLVLRAETYMNELVDCDGKNESEARDSYSWSGKQSRLTHAIHQHLHISIETAMKQVLADANSQLVKGIQETVKAKLQEVAAKLKVTADLGR
jgi:hypothetical protein